MISGEKWSKLVGSAREEDNDGGWTVDTAGQNARLKTNDEARKEEGAT